MYVNLRSACVQGIDGRIIDVEIDCSHGLPQINIVGLPDSAVREATDRVRAAIRNSGFKFPQDRITVNLAPADMRKEGAAFDLAIAAGILFASRQWQSVSSELSTQSMWIGELALDGCLRPIRGVLAMVEAAVANGYRHILLAQANMNEASLIKNAYLHPLQHLREAQTFLEANHQPIEIATKNPIRSVNTGEPVDLIDVQGQAHAKRALLIAAAGMHHLLMIGPPGTGKTMLAQRLISILPELSEQECLEVTKLHSVSKQHQTPLQQLIQHRPFRNPHHNVSKAGLIGGGSTAKPGEISLAHRGVLFLDELSEFPRSTLEQLRQPLEQRTVTIARVRSHIQYPAHCLLVAAMNPCPCGYLGHPLCNCSEYQIKKYYTRLSGPLIERIDLQIEMPRVDDNVWTLEQNQQKNRPKKDGMDSHQARMVVEVAQQIQFARNNGRFNSDLTPTNLHQVCSLTSECRALLAETYRESQISVRIRDRLLKVARTIADLEGSLDISTQHLAEALQYRALDRSLHNHPMK